MATEEADPECEFQPQQEADTTGSPAGSPTAIEQ